MNKYDVKQLIGFVYEWCNENGFYFDDEGERVAFETRIGGRALPDLIDAITSNYGEKTASELSYTISKPFGSNLYRVEIKELEINEDTVDHIYWKVYSNACTVGHPIQDVSHKWGDVLDEVLNYQLEEALNGYCDYASRKTRKLVERYNKLVQEDEEIGVPQDQMDNVRGEMIIGLYGDLEWALNNDRAIACGDWGLMKLPDYVTPERPNSW